MNNDIIDNNDAMKEDYNINNLPKRMNIKGVDFIITKYSGKVEDYDNINRKGNEIVLPLRLLSYDPIEINEKNNKPIDMQAAIFFLQNAINKINNKYEFDNIKTLIREDIIHINLQNDTLNMHPDGIIHDINRIDLDNSIIFIPICISLSNPVGHLNVLVINNMINKISLYEPMGIHGLLQTIPKIEKDKLVTSFNYIKFLLNRYKDYTWTSSYIDRYMTQRRSDIYQTERYNIREIYCVAWCSYLCLFRIFNLHLQVDIPAFVILEEIYKELLFKNDDVNEFIRRFVSLINDSTDNYEGNNRTDTLFHGFEQCCIITQDRILDL
jgi:hypothetical protein